MNYHSTRGGCAAVSSAQAIVEGLAPDGGLYTMEVSRLPKLDCRRLLALDTFSMAAEIVSALLPDFSRAEAEEMVKLAYSDKFPELMCPAVSVGDKFVLELSHGPTSAFKDVALCLLPRLMTAAAKKCGNDEDILILTATSGDTGKAAMEGFRDVEGIRIIVFYPRDGVSAVQRAQMLTQQGKNVKVCAVEGNFDDAQSGVKRIFEALPDKGLSSANSINIGRLVPQVVYYFSAYAAVLGQGRISYGDKLDYVVPTGNFGDILAGYLAAGLGLPVGKLVCASNVNNVLTDFLRTGVYDRRREFFRSSSPSMDILISSNLERLLYLMSGDSALVASLMKQLKNEGHYSVSQELLSRLQSCFWAGCCDDEATAETINKVWKEHNYLCDTHTAVAWNVAEQYEKAEPEHAPIVVLSTASPYKFPAAVLEAISDEERADDEFEMMEELAAFSGTDIPENLRGLREKEILHTDCVKPEDMQSYVIKQLEVKSWQK